MIKPEYRTEITVIKNGKVVETEKDKKKGDKK
jgi:hypothetical protein